MIHAICDFCGKDMDRTGNLLTITAFQNFARYHTDTRPYGSEEKPRSFCICSSCMKKHRLPNPYHDYRSISGQKLSYEKAIDNYTEQDMQSDIASRRQETSERAVPAPDCEAPLDDHVDDGNRGRTPGPDIRNDSDLSEFTGQLIDIVEDFMDKEYVKQVHIEGENYGYLKEKFLETLRNWKLLPPE